MQAKSKPAFLSREVDLLMIGGASVLLFLLAQFAVDKNASTHGVSWFAYWLSYIVNYPHFLASYQLFYGDYRTRLWEKKFIWAGFIVPIALALSLWYAMANADAVLLGNFAELMFFLVGWHYVKQIFGITIVSAAAHQVYLSSIEKHSLRLNLFALWALSWVASQSGQTHKYLGIGYTTFTLPTWCQPFALGTTIATLVLVLLLALRKYVNEGKAPPLLSSMAFLTIYIWYIPAFYHPTFFFMVPFFHSLQYLLFVLAMKNNKASDQDKSLDGISFRKNYVLHFFGFLFLATLLGSASFEWVPNFLDGRYEVFPEQLGTQIFLFAFYIFINIHHYFIDNVIWTRDNPDLSKYLVKAAQN